MTTLQDNPQVQSKARQPQATSPKAQSSGNLLDLEIARQQSLAPPSDGAVAASGPPNLIDEEIKRRQASDPSGIAERFTQEDIQFAREHSFNRFEGVSDPDVAYAMAEDMIFQQGTIEAYSPPEESRLDSVLNFPRRVWLGATEGLITDPSINVAQFMALLAKRYGNDELKEEFLAVAEDYDKQRLAKRRRGDEESEVFGTAKVAGALAPQIAGVVLMPHRAAGTFALKQTMAFQRMILAYFGIQAMGGAFGEIEEARKRGEKVSDLEELMIVIGYGTAEVIVEKLQFKAIGGLTRKTAGNLGKFVAGGKYRTAAIFTADIFTVAGTELVEEVITQFAQNSIANRGFFIGDGFDPERKLTEGVADAAKGGLKGGLMLSVAALMSPAGRRAFQEAKAREIEEQFTPQELHDIRSEALQAFVVGGRRKQIELQEEGVQRFGFELPDDMAALTDEERTEAIEQLDEVIKNKVNPDGAIASQAEIIRARAIRDRLEEVGAAQEQEREAQDSFGLEFFTFNTDDLTREEAVTRIDSEGHAKGREFAESVDALFFKESKVLSAVGFWSDGAEDAYVSFVEGDVTADLLRYTTAIKARAGRQKAALTFLYGPEGMDVVYEAEFEDITIEALDDLFQDSGIPSWTIVRDGPKLTAYVVEQGGETLAHEFEVVARAGGSTNGQTKKGTAEFLEGETGQGAGENEARESSARLYGAIIDSHERAEGSQVFRGDDDQRRSDQGEAKPDQEVTPRQRSKLDQIIERLEKRQAEIPGALGRGKGKGARPGATNLFEQVALASGIISLKVIRSGVRGVKATRAFIRKLVDEQFPDLRRHLRSISRNVNRLVARSVDEEGNFDEEAFNASLDSLQTEASKRDRESKGTIKQRIAQAIRGATQTPTITEREALAAVKRAERRTAKQAFRAGLNHAQAQIIILRARLKAQQANTRERIEKEKEHRRESVAREKERAAISEELRTRARRIVKAVVDKQDQGRFLKRVSGLKTEKNFEKFLDDLQDIVASRMFKEEVADFRGTIKKAAKAKLDNETRKRIRGLEDVGRAIAFTAGGGTKRMLKLDRDGNLTAAEQLRPVTADILTQLADVAQTIKAIKAGRTATAIEHITTIVGNVESIKPLRSDEQIYEDLEVNGVARWFRGQLDVDNLARMVERLWRGDGDLRQLLSVRPKEQEEKYNSAQRDAWQWLDGRVHKAGFDNLSKALEAMDATLGTSNAQRIDVTLGGRKMSILLGEALDIAAMDADTLARVADGRRMQMDSARQRRALAVTVEEIEKIQEQVGTDLIELVQDMKDYLEFNVRPDLFAVHFRLKGYEPQMIEGYWPSFSNPDATSRIDIEGGGNLLGEEIREHLLENANFMKERRGGNAPLLIRPALSKFIQHVDRALRVTHMAEVVSDAAAVITNQRFVEAVNGRFGGRMNEMLQAHLLAASLTNLDTGTRGDRIIRSLNNNLAGAFQTLNEGTYLRQLGGVFKLWPIMGEELFLEGIKRMRPGTSSKAMNHSGFIWSRYHGSSFARFSPLRAGGDVDALDSSDNWLVDVSQSALAIANALAKADPRGFSKSWERMVRSIKILDWFDFVPGRIAWEGYEFDVRRRHPNWTDERVLAETSLLAATAIRSTQNSSSPLDATTFATESRNSLIRTFLLFTSDPMKSYNMIVASLHQGPKQAAKVATGVLTNTLFSVGAGLFTRTWPVALALLLSGGGDDKRKAEILEQELHESMFRFARESLNVFYGGDALVTIIEAAQRPYKRGQAGSSPLIQTFNELGDAVSQVLVPLFSTKTPRESGQWVDSVLKGLTEIGEASNALAGNPLLIPYYRAKKFIQELNREDEPRGQVTS